MKIKFRKIYSPKNIDSLLYSLSIPLEISYIDLKKLINIYIPQNKYTKFNNITLNSLIKNKYNLSINDFIKRINTKNYKSDVIELNILSKLFNINLFIINNNKQIINNLINNLINKNIFLFYHDNIFNYLKVTNNPSDILA